MPHQPVNYSRKKETAVLIGLIHKHQNEQQVAEYLDELAFLAETAGAVSKKRFTQRLEKPDHTTFIGSGKLAEIQEYVKLNQIDLAVFDDELSGSQIRNIEKVLSCRVLDRNNLILDIFAKRARTAQAKTQVELAQYRYLLPRLTRMWTHLEKQRGGIGLRGPGETEIETDRRVIKDKLSRLKAKLKEIEKQSETQRKLRKDLVRVALVGYTNVGKSTLMNLLCKSDVFAENKLFATLDTTVRKLVYENIPFLISDTVGFIRKLPHDLIESFKSTLDEVREADILVHVADISHPQFEDHISVVRQTLLELGAAEKTSIIVFNKIDAYRHVEKEEDDLLPATRENMTLEELKRSWISRIGDNCVFISATDKTNIDELRNKLTSLVKEIHFQRYPNYLYKDEEDA
ncbi:MAG: GTPase HflX [Bacteroidetes bacterium]|nr:MAG: GTPase HflX [Bacteroidota bacterium]